MTTASARAEAVAAAAKPQGYWPTLWDFIGQNLERAAWRRRLEAETRQWIGNDRRSDRRSHERLRVREAVAALSRPTPPRATVGSNA